MTPLSRCQIFFFCQVQILWTALTLFQAQWLDYYYLNWLNLNTDTLGIIYAFSASLNFILAPIIAHWFDRQIANKTQNPLRSRSNILLQLTVIMGISSIMLVWIPTQSQNNIAQMVWLSIWSTVNNVISTIFLANWQSLSFALTTDSKQRSLLFGWSSAVGSATEIVTSFLFGWLPMQYFNLFNIICCISMTISFYSAILYLRPPNDTLHQPLLNHPDEVKETISLVPSLIRVFTNHPFRIFFFSYLLCNIYLMAPRDTILLQYGFKASQNQIALTNSLSQVICLFATPIIVILSHNPRIGNKGAYMILVGGWALLVMSCIMFVSSPHQILYWVLVLGDALFGGLQGMVSNSLLAEIIDYDQLRWGTLTNKATLYNSIIGDASGWDSLVDSLSYGCLSLLGFRSGDDADLNPNSNQVIQGLKWMCFFSAVPGLLSCLVMMKYPITQKIHETIITLIPERHLIHDPITNQELTSRFLQVSLNPHEAHQQHIRNYFSLWELTQFSLSGTTRLRWIIATYITIAGLILATVIAILWVIGLGQTILLEGMLCFASISIVIILLHVLRFQRIKDLDSNQHQIINEIVIT